MFEIKKGIPVAERSVSRGGGGSPAKYNFAGMDVGDCFDAPDDMGCRESGHSRRQGTLLGSANTYAKRHNPTAKFTTRKIGNVIRCWRIA